MIHVKKNQQNPKQQKSTHTQRISSLQTTLFFNFYLALHQLLNCDIDTLLPRTLKSFNLNQKDACPLFKRQ